LVWNGRLRKVGGKTMSKRGLVAAGIGFMLVTLPAAMVLAAPVPPAPPGFGSVQGPHSIPVVSSTIEPINGDKSPYGLAIAPANTPFADRR